MGQRLPTNKVFLSTGWAIALREFLCVWHLNALSSVQRIESDFGHYVNPFPLACISSNGIPNAQAS